jgi:hypothetical protein
VHYSGLLHHCSIFWYGQEQLACGDIESTHLILYWETGFYFCRNPSDVALSPVLVRSLNPFLNYHCKLICFIYNNISNHLITMVCIRGREMISTRRLTTCIDFTLTKKRHGHRLYKLPRVKQILDGPFLPRRKATESLMKTCLSISPKSILLLCILYFPCTITIRYRFTTSERKPDQQALLILPAQS